MFCYIIPNNGFINKNKHDKFILNSSIDIIIFYKFGLSSRSTIMSHKHWQILNTYKLAFFTLLNCCSVCTVISKNLFKKREISISCKKYNLKNSLPLDPSYRSFLYFYDPCFAHKFSSFPAKCLFPGRQVLVTQNDFTTWLKERSNRRNIQED